MTIHGNLENIQDRLCNCLAVFRLIQSNMDSGSLEVSNAMQGACDLLDSILEDFTADLAYIDLHIMTR